MPKTYSRQDTEEFLFHVGVAYSMNYGPEGSGKTHLGFIFKEIMNAKFIKHLKKDDLFSVKKGKSYILDNFDLKTKNNQEILMHFFNECYSGSGSILILSKTPPGVNVLTLTFFSLQ